MDSSLIFAVLFLTSELPLFQSFALSPHFSSSALRGSAKLVADNRG
jgi:hypothetical protein